MHLGLSLGHSGLVGGPADQLALTRVAEEAGFDSIWASEAYGSDAATVLGWLAGQTERVRLGSAIFQMPGRSPALTAMTAATLDNLSGGRAVLGLGLSGPQVAEGWHGQRFGPPLGRTRDYVAVVRQALAGERLEYRGEVYELPLPNGPGKPLKLTIRPAQERIPIYVAALGPRNTELVGEIADGWIPLLFAPEHAGAARELLARGAARAGRRPDEIELAPLVQLRIDDDIDRARDAMRPVLALYVGGMGSREKNFYNALVRRYGFEEAAEEIQDRYLAGDKAAAAAAVPDELIDLTTLAGPPEHVRSRLAAYRAAGVGTLIAMPLPGTPAAQRREVQLLGELRKLDERLGG